MIRNINTAKLTKTYIESKISQELIDAFSETMKTRFLEETQK